MTTAPRLANITAIRTDLGIDLVIEDSEGEIFKVLATEEQVDSLVDSLDELLGVD